MKGRKCTTSKRILGILFRLTIVFATHPAHFHENISQVHIVAAAPKPKKQSKKHGNCEKASITC